MPYSPHSPQAIASQEKVAYALKLRREYKPWAEVAQLAGYADAGSACKTVSREMARRRAEMAVDIDALRDEEAERLDMLASVAMRVLNTMHFTMSAGQVVERDGVPLEDDGPVLAAIDRLLRISESKRKLFGIDAPVKVEAAVNVSFTVEGIAPEDMP